MRQYTEWGYVDWESLPEDGDEKRWMSVGIVHVAPHAEQELHVHYGHEQMLYVLKGNGNSNINGENILFKPGDHIVMPSDSTHQFTNNSDYEVVELLVSNPIPIGYKRNNKEGRIQYCGEMDFDIKHKDMLYTACEQLKGSLLNIVTTPCCILDANLGVVMKNDAYPKSCINSCDPIFAPQECECYQCKYLDGRIDGSETTFTCKYGMKVFFVPIIFNDKIIGTVRGGHFFSSMDAAQYGGIDEKGRYDSPISAEISVLRVLHRISDSVEDYLRVLYSVSLLEEQKKILNEAKETNAILNRDLSAIEEKVTNLKINHHFLFNTLNCMAGMALTGEKSDLYKSIINLSKMFRYTMVSDIEKVTLSKELEYLNTYLSLQKLRYKDGLKVQYEIEDECLDVSVPFNFLQPIVENAFIHGFMSYDFDKLVVIKIDTIGRKIRILMQNNGIGMMQEAQDRANRSLKSGSGHGLSLIYDKLKQCYDDNFLMEVGSVDGMTTIKIEIPK